jgi:tyrosinase
MTVISPSRRNFVRGMAAMPFALWLARARADGGTLTRYDASSPMGLTMLQIYADAVTQMKLRNPDNPLSWVWQWYTHFVDGATTKAAEITRIFGPDPTPQSTFANEVWNTCQSHSGQNTNYFLPWHRIFVLFFEDVIRSVTGHPEFTLPYWNYTSSDPTKRAIVPAQFRLPNDPVWGSLYRPDRTSLANSGQRIDKNQTSDQMDVSAAMATTSYSNVGTVLGFCRSIDSGIHGKIHVLTGTSKNMGAVPYAARDPLFWCHHISIDRLWAIWNLNGGVNPTTATWAQKYFTFADGQGQRVTGKLADYFDLSTLGYTYDDLASPAAAATKTRSKTASTALRLSANTVPEEVARGVSEANLGAKPVRVELQRVPGAALTDVVGLSNTADGKRTYLALKNLHTWKQPEVLFHVYLTPGRGTHALERANYVGAINFFDAEFHDHGHGAMGDVLGENFYSFDVTEILSRIASSSLKADARNSLFVTFVPGGQPTSGANPLVATIELARQ